MSDLQETVYIAKGRSRSKKYHVDKDCHRFPDPYREMDLDMARAWNYDQCKECDP